ncbi:hypothetical protein [Natronorubrum sp. DTA7]
MEYDVVQGDIAYSDEEYDTVRAAAGRATQSEFAAADEADR